MKKRVGFIGLGAMGKPMAKRLVQADYTVVVSPHRNRRSVDELVQLGAEHADNPAGVAATSDVVLMIVPDAPDVEEACFGPEGIIHGKRAEHDLVVIDMSTISPLATRVIAACLKEAGIEMLDAPVSGGIWRAASGELTIMVGGEADVLEQQRDILSVLGTNIVHAGPTGQGEVIKMANNMIAGMLMPVISEALTLGIKAGANLDILRQVISTSSGNNYIFEKWLPNTLFCSNFEDGFALELLRKDLGIALEVACELDVPLYEAGLAYQIYTQAKGLGYGREDFSAVSKLYQQAANIDIVARKPLNV